MTPTPCDACEFRDRPETCHALASGHRRFCDLVTKGVPGYRELVRRRTLDEPSRPAMARSSVAAAAMPTRPSAAESKRRLTLVKGCPHFEKATNCGCGVNRCLIGKGRKGDGLVSLTECLECVSQANPPP